MHSHWKIDYRKIIGIYRNFDSKLLHSYFTTVSEVFLELISRFRGVVGANSFKSININYFERLVSLKNTVTTER